MQEHNERLFHLRNQLVQDYKSYVSSFIQIRDEKIHAYVEDQVKQGLLWPEPLIRLILHSSLVIKWKNLQIKVFYTKPVNPFSVEKAKTTLFEVLTATPTSGRRYSCSPVWKKFTLTYGTGWGKYRLHHPNR